MNEHFIHGFIDEMEKIAAGSISAAFPGKIPRNKLLRVLHLMFSPKTMMRAGAVDLLRQGHRMQGAYHPHEKDFRSGMRDQIIQEARSPHHLSQAKLTALANALSIPILGGAGYAGYRLFGKKKEKE